MNDQTEWTLAICGILTLLLRGGLGMYLAGAARSKNAAAAVYRAFGEICLAALAFALIGNLILGGSAKLLLLPGCQPSAHDFFLITAMLIPPAILSSATMERSRAIVWIVGSILMAGIITPLIFRMESSNWLRQMGFSDAGGAAGLHFSAGLAALVLAWQIGSRAGKYNRDGSTNMVPGHNSILSSVGLLIIFATWPGLVFGFSDVSLANVGVILFNILLGGASAGCIAMLYTYLRFRRRDLDHLQSAILSGLVAISGIAAGVSPAECILVGAIAGFAGPLVQIWMDIVWKLDDPGGLAAIFAVGGLIGSLAAPLLLAGELSLRIQRFGGQCVGIIIIAAISLGMPLAVFSIIRKITPLRSREADETDGLDLAEHDLNAYPDFQQTTIKSHHLREM